MHLRVPARLTLALVSTLALVGCVSGPKAKPFEGMDPAPPEYRNTESDAAEDPPAVQGQQPSEAPAAPGR